MGPTSAAQVLPHLNHPNDAKFALDEIEERRHDRTPLLINASEPDPDSCRGDFERRAKWFQDSVGVWNARGGGHLTRSWRCPGRASAKVEVKAARLRGDVIVNWHT